MVVEPENSLNYRRVAALVILPIVLSILVLYQFPTVVSRFHYQQASNELQHNNLDPALTALTSALNSTALYILPNDRKRLLALEGDLRMSLAVSSSSLKTMVEQLEKAETAYLHAIEIQPLDVFSYTDLARAREVLERVYPVVKKRTYTKPALPVLKQAEHLMPANMYIHSLLLKYYDSRGMGDQLKEAVGTATALFPSLYFQLVKQPFYVKAMDGIIKDSLHKAINSNTRKIEAFRALSILSEQEGDIELALVYYREMLAARNPVIDQKGYLELGRLHLKGGNNADAATAFTKALSLQVSESVLNQLYRIYASQKQYRDFLLFSQNVSLKNVPEYLGILKAEALIAVNEYELARSNLIRIKSKRLLPESFYLQAKIAEKKKDWDTMELRSQRATVLDSKNYKYHQLFSRSLQRQGKYYQAEKAIDQAIETYQGQKHWLYNERAWIKWHRKDFEGAAADWQKAIADSPDIAGFYFKLARVYDKTNNYTLALKNLNKAISLDPDKPEYLKMLTELKNKN